MISLLNNKLRVVSMMALAMFLAFIIGCVEQDTMKKDDDMKKEETRKREGSY